MERAMLSACWLLSPLQKRSKVYSSLRNDCIASPLGAVGCAALGASGVLRVLGRCTEAFPALALGSSSTSSFHCTRVPRPNVS